jgi:subtilisin family serine protease
LSTVGPPSLIPDLAARALSAAADLAQSTYEIQDPYVALAFAVCILAAVVAAGTFGSNRPFYPAALKNCIAVGALESDGERRAEFSNHGWWVDACAVTQNVAGPFLTDTMPDGQTFDGFATWSGTSFAAPRVAGAIAQFVASRHVTAVARAGSPVDARLLPDAECRLDQCPADVGDVAGVGAALCHSRALRMARAGVPGPTDAAFPRQVYVRRNHGAVSG